ncbi:hypothetical protein B0H14DRAFT_3470891 [Mycena olivaceomarginata]|nr:hypothetical protein B0H14DRAFT_3470891 [Mycena olivaceomarginata]
MLPAPEVFNEEGEEEKDEEEEEEPVHPTKQQQTSSSMLKGKSKAKAKANTPTPSTCGKPKKDELPTCGSPYHSIKSCTSAKSFWLSQAFRKQL